MKSFEIAKTITELHLITDQYLIANITHDFEAQIVQSFEFCHSVSMYMPCLGYKEAYYSNVLVQTTHQVTLVKVIKQKEEQSQSG